MGRWGCELLTTPLASSIRRFEYPQGGAILTRSYAYYQTSAWSGVLIPGKWHELKEWRFIVEDYWHFCGIENAPQNRSF
jgi:hypothetical protein